MWAKKKFIWKFLYIYIVLIHSDVQGTTCFPVDYSFLDSFRGLSEEFSVVVCQIEDVENEKISPHLGVISVLPSFSVRVEELLAGAEIKDRSILGTQTIFPQFGEWLMAVGGGIPWIIPGQRTLLLLVYNNEGGLNGMGCYHIKEALFLGQGPITDSTPLMRASTRVDRKVLRESPLTTPLQEMFRAVTVKLYDSGYTIGDIKRALLEKKEN